LRASNLQQRPGPLPTLTSSGVGAAAGRPASGHREAPLSSKPGARFAGVSLVLLVACGSRPDTLGGLVISTNEGDDTLTVISPISGQARSPILVPVVVEANMEMPHELSTDPLGRFLVAGLMEMPLSFANSLASTTEIAMMNSTLPGYLLKFNPDGTLAAKLQVEEDNGDNALSLDGEVAFVSHYDLPKIFAARQAGDTDVRHMDSNLWAIETAGLTAISKTPICPAAHIIQLSPDGGTLYATCLPDEIAVVDVTDPRSLRVQRVPEIPGTVEDPTNAQLSPFALQVAPLDGSVWVSNWLSKDVRVMDASSRNFVATLPLNATPFFTTFSSDGKTAYVCHQAPDGVTVFDAVSRQRLSDHALAATDCIAPHQLLVFEGGTIGGLLCEGDHKSPGSYLKVDLSTWAIVSRTATGIYPVEMDLLPKLGG
jgi:DNA-binding beta-propeller fold protein YncE